jgi:AraC-like DNA-binding protein
VSAPARTVLTLGQGSIEPLKSGFLLASKPVAVVARRVGDAPPSAFVAAFRGEPGVSPGAFRR